MPKFTGVYPVLPTPFTTTGQVDQISFRRVVRNASAAGIDGMTYPANASESFTLTAEERIQLLEALLDETNNRIPVIAGITSPTAEESHMLARHAAESGAAALLLMPPTGCSADVISFCRTAIAELPLPVFLQNGPPPLGPGLDLQPLMHVMEELPQAVYIKEEGMPSGQRIAWLQQKFGSRLHGVFGGDGGRFILNELRRGAAGTMPAVEIIELHVQLLRLYRQDDEKQAYALFQQMLPILNMQRVYRWALTKRILRWRRWIDHETVRVKCPSLDQVDDSELKLLFNNLPPLSL